MNWIPKAIKSSADNAEITALNGTWGDFVASADVLDGNLSVCDASELSEMTDGRSVAIVEPEFVRGSSVECSCR